MKQYLVFFFLNLILVTGAFAIKPLLHDCDGHRRDINSYSIVDRIDLKNCIMTYLSQQNPNWQQGDPIWEKYTIVKEHSEPNNLGFWHNGKEVGFWTEHRNYIQRLEQWLLENGCSKFVPLPKWNPKNGIPDEFFKPEHNPWLPGFAPLQNQNPNMSHPPITEDICNKFPTIDDYAANHDDFHGNVHVTIGGCMANIYTSPAAAIFWLWHAYVDEVYYCYQQLCQGCEPPYLYPVGIAKNCDYCFDFSKNVNVQSVSVVLIDDQGVQTSITLTPKGNCIPYKFLKSLGNYTVKITGTNTSSQSELCNMDVVTLNFTAPYQPPARKIGKLKIHPCLLVEAEEVPNTNNGFLIRNTGDKRIFRIYNVHTTSGAIYIINNFIELDTDEITQFIIPPAMIPSGSNHLVVEVEGDYFEYQYLNGIE